MPIETDFTFHQEHVARPGLAPAAPTTVDFLGLLRGFVGGQPGAKNQRTWKGTGFNMIWRPDSVTQSDHFLELNLTDETLSFNEISGTTGVANRGLLQQDVFLGAVAYVQSINDAFDNTGQHFEPGVWASVPLTTNPNEKSSVVRMGSIPHGSTINLQGQAFSVPAPQFAVSTITPFQIGSPDDGATNLVHFPEETLTNASQFRTDLARSRQPDATAAQQSKPFPVASDRQSNHSQHDCIVGNERQQRPPGGARCWRRDRQYRLLGRQGRAARRRTKRQLRTGDRHFLDRKSKGPQWP